MSKADFPTWNIEKTVGEPTRGDSSSVNLHEFVNGWKMFEIFTPPKTNMPPKNQWLEDVFPIETVPF